MMENTKWEINRGTDEESADALGIHTFPCFNCGGVIVPEEDCWTRVVGAGTVWAMQYLCLRCEEELYG